MLPTLDERLKISTTKQLQDGATIKTFNDDDYELESLTLEEESRLGKLELDDKMNENKRKRSLNALLSEQRVQGACFDFLIISIFFSNFKNNSYD